MELDNSSNQVIKQLYINFSNFPFIHLKYLANHIKQTKEKYTKETQKHPQTKNEDENHRKTKQKKSQQQYQ